MLTTLCIILVALILVRLTYPKKVQPLQDVQIIELPRPWEAGGGGQQMRTTRPVWWYEQKEASRARREERYGS